MKRLLIGALLLIPTCHPRLYAETEQPPFEVSDPATTENFRQIYYTLDKLRVVPSGDLVCIDSPVFCVNWVNHSVSIGTATINSVNITTATINYVNITTANVQNINGTFIGLGRNRIINGDMRIDQRFAGSSTTINDTTLYTADRWAVSEVTDGVLGYQRRTASPPTGFTHYLTITSSATDSSIGAAQIAFVSQGIEGNVSRDMFFGSAQAKTVALSFWVRSTLTGTYTGFLRNSANNRGYPFEYTIDSANTWERKTTTFVGDITGTWTTDVTRGIQIGFNLAAGSNFHFTANTWAAGSALSTANQVNFLSSANRTWDLTGVQFEISPLATSYEYRPESLELFLCQRYFEKSYAVETSLGTATNTNRTNPVAAQLNTTSMYATVRFKVMKRAQPTVTVYNAGTGATGSADWISTAGVSTTRTTTAVDTGTVQFAFSQTVAVEYLCLGQFGADSEL